MELIFCATWHTYEEWGGLAIWQDGDLYYCSHGGYNVFGSDDGWHPPVQCSELAAISDMEKFCQMLTFDSGGGDYSNIWSQEERAMSTMADFEFLPA